MLLIHLSSVGPPSPAQRVPLGTRRAIAMAALRVADPALADGFFQPPPIRRPTPRMNLFGAVGEELWGRNRAAAERRARAG